MLWWAVWMLPKSLGEGILACVERVWKVGWLSRWSLWTAPGSVAELLERRWAELGIELIEEMLLLYDGHTVVGVVGMMAVAGMVALSFVPAIDAWIMGLPMHGLELVGLFVVGFVVLLWQVVWRAWVAYLYGVETWDLRAVMALARWMGMKEPREDDH
jgi:hypothetical protein